MAELPVAELPAHTFGSVMPTKIRFDLRSFLIASAFAPPLLAGVSSAMVWAAIEFSDWQRAAENPVHRLERRIDLFPDRLPSAESPKEAKQ